MKICYHINTPSIHNNLKKYASFTVVLILIFTALSLGAQTTFLKDYGELSDSDYGYSIVQIEGGDYIICGDNVHPDTLNGGFNSAGVLRRIDENGNELWVNSYFDPNSDYQNLTFNDVKPTQDGNLIVAGTSRYDYYENYKEFYLTKIDNDGNSLWQHTYGGLFGQGAMKVIETSDGGFLMTGFNEVSNSSSTLSSYTIKTDFSGNVEWEYLHPNTNANSETHYSYSILETEEGDFLIAGGIHQEWGNATDFHLLKVSSFGELIWEQIVDHDIGGEGREVFLKNNGHILLCGWYAPNMIARPLVIELDDDGNFLDEFDLNYNNAIREWAYAFHKDELDNLTMLSFDIDGNFRVTQVDEMYNTNWSNFIQYDNSSFPTGYAIEKTSDGGYICTGNISIDGDNQCVAFKLNQNGALSTKETNLTHFDISLYPNPSPDFIYLSILNLRPSNVVLFDIQGNLIQEFDKNEKRLDLSQISSGLYLLKIESDNSVLTRKIVVQR